MKKIAAILFFFIFGTLFSHTDLEDGRQTFVLKTQKITIDGYPDAFNPSIIRWKGHLLMSFRTRDSKTGIANLVGLVWLNDNFQPVSKPQILKTDQVKHIQDPRLIAVDNRLYMPFSALFKYNGKEERRMCLGELYYDGFNFSLANKEPILHFEGDGHKFEKNWVPFDYNGYFLLSYSIFPHKVFLPLFGEQKCLIIDYSESINFWNFGEVRGGTQALKIENQYLSFFHSSIEMATEHSKGKEIPHYFMGAYTFAASPPFKINKMSPAPIVGPNYYEGEEHNTWKPLRVVFPGGFVFDDTYIWVAYGRQDHEVWIVQLDRKGLFDSLIPVSLKK